MKKEYQVGTKTFTEKDFENPPPLEERSLEYIIAYANWERDNGLLIEFKNTKEAVEWVRNTYLKNK